MATILCIETATTNCSVALSVNGSVIALKEDYNTSYSHAERLHVYIEEILSLNNITKSQLDAIAVSKGPGSYTGLRIGVSAAKGLCFALEIPLISIPTLDSLAQQIKEKEGIVVPMIDARRMEVYAAVYDAKLKNQIRETRAEVLDENSFKEYLEEGFVYFIGDGVDKFKTICKHKNAIFMEGKLPSANNMGKIVNNKYKKSDIEDVAYFEPYYLKDFISG